MHQDMKPRAMSHFVKPLPSILITMKHPGRSESSYRYGQQHEIIQIFRRIVVAETTGLLDLSRGIIYSESYRALMQ